MAEYEPIFPGGATAPPPPSSPPPLLKKKDKKKKKAAMEADRSGTNNGIEQGNDEEFAQSAYSIVGNRAEDGAKAGKQTTTCGRVCCYLLLFNLIVCAVAAAVLTVALMMDGKLPFLPADDDGKQSSTATLSAVTGNPN